MFRTSIVVAALILPPTVAHATNGMDLEGYGPIAAAMGGASLAYDNGTAAMMNNPATLGLMEDSRLDLAFGVLSPHVSSTRPGSTKAKSSADAFFMPAFGWVAKRGAFSYGFGVFSQGGMGTHYTADSFIAQGSGQPASVKLGVGRALIPLVYEINSDLSLGVSADLVWAGMDLGMPLSGAQFGDMVAELGGPQTFGKAGGAMADTLVGAFTGGMLAKLNYARFDFTNNNAFTNNAMGAGYAGKVGVVYRPTPRLAFGATYHSKTRLADLKTRDANMSMEVVLGAGMGGGTAVVPLSGKLSVVDFQWPQTAGVGTAFQATENLLLAADYKWINWAAVMKDFHMVFTADKTQASPLATAFGMGGQSLDATVFQKWRDQHVVMLGAAYRISRPLTLRGGLNLANNPVPDKYLNVLFPAIIRNHATVGLGWAFGGGSSVDASFAYAPKSEAISGQGVASAHSQTNMQIMYSYRFMGAPTSRSRF